MENKCKKCGCDDAIPVAPCLDPTGCPEPEKCEETFDLACINYSGEPLECGGQIILNTNESLESGLLNITDKICDSINTNLAFFDVTFTQPQTLRLVANVSGGVAPYTYEWIAEKSNVPTGPVISGATNTNILNFTIVNQNLSKGSRLASIITNGNNIYMYRHAFVHLKLKITDSIGKTDIKNFMYYCLIGQSPVNYA